MEVLYLVDPVDEYCMQSLPDFDGKMLMNVAKEGLKLDGSDKGKEQLKRDEEEFKPLTEWLKETALKDQIEKAVVSQRLHLSPCALVANSFGWSGNMERLMRSQAYSKSQDPMQDFYATQKKTLEINPRHPLVRELLSRVQSDKDDAEAMRSAQLLFEMTVVRSGYSLRDAQGFADRIESMLRSTLNVSPDAVVVDDDVDSIVDESEVKDSEKVQDTTKDPNEIDDIEPAHDSHDEHVEL